MGLDDILPDDSSDTHHSHSSPSESSTQSDPSHHVIGSGDTSRSYIPTRWKKLKRVITREMGLSVEEVLEKPPEERNEILDHADNWYDDDFEQNTSAYRSTTRCTVCRQACDEHYVEINGEKFCVQHTAGQIARALDTS